MWHEWRQLLAELSTRRTERASLRIAVALAAISFVPASCALIPGPGRQEEDVLRSCTAVHDERLMGITAVEDDTGHPDVRLKDGTVVEAEWPRETSFVIVGDAVEIHRFGEPVAQVGDPLDMGGVLTSDSLDICSFRPS